MSEPSKAVVEGLLEECFQITVEKAPPGSRFVQVDHLGKLAELRGFDAKAVVRDRGGHRSRLTDPGRLFRNFGRRVGRRPLIPPAESWWYRVD